MAQVETSVERNGLEIAVVGMAGRFPRAGNVTTLWRNLQAGVEALTFFTVGELLDAGISPTLLAHPDYVRSRGSLEDIDLFDAAFFDIVPDEATIMDPQHRIFLECAWEALEDAGYDPEAVAGLVGLYTGVGINIYSGRVRANRKLVTAMSSFMTTMASEKDHLATRVSYELNLRGPSLTVQTFCSTSLVATHLACQGLLGGSCDLALAGAVSISAQQKRGYLYQEGSIASPDGHCRAFDAKAKGTVGGSGVAIVVLKRLEDALADGDTVHAIIKGSAINNDGSRKVGYTAPSVDGQARVICDALAMGEVSPESITYVEAHGTGTELGDPIEIKGLTQAFRTATDEKNFCAVGSVKTNLGHLDTAAGVTGLIKTVLMLKHRTLVPSLHFERPNPEIDFANSPFYVNTQLRPWTTDRLPRRAGVSSFGIGGTNAHVVVEEAPAPAPRTEPSPTSHLIILSAKTETALETMTGNLIARLRDDSCPDIADVSYTLQVGRRAFRHRRALVCRAAADAVAALTERDPRRVRDANRATVNRSVAFMFPGQGAQSVGMGRELYERERVFREQLDACAELLRTHLGQDLRRVLYPAAGQEEAAREQLKQTALTQPALFAVEYALAQTWLAWGVAPQAMIGHSLGEYVAACLASVLSLEDALALVAARGRLMQQMPRGAMLAVAVPEAELAAYLTRGLSVAAVNGETQCVVSGAEQAVEELARRLTEEGKAARRLETSHAFHSELMLPALEPFRAEVERVRLKAPRLPFVSNVTGTWITPEQATDPGYWVKHLYQPVRFSAGLDELFADADRVLLEVGPGATLSGFAKRKPARTDAQAVISSLPRRSAADTEAGGLLEATAALWLTGVPVNWAATQAGRGRRRVPLPTYPFERKRYWAEPDAAPQSAPHVAEHEREAVPVEVQAQPQPVACVAQPAPAERVSETVTTATAQACAPSDPAVEQFIAGQLQLISQQLDLLGESVL
jgi:acyl transferase domain-containing protein